MYKLASKLKIRFQITLNILENFSNKIATGLMTVEQLWELPIPVLDRLAVELEDKYKASGKKSFLIKKSKKDKILKLKLDVVLDILETKVEEKDAAQDAAGIKEHNQKIMDLIAQKKDENLKDMDIKDLEKMLK